LYDNQVEYAKKVVRVFHLVIAVGTGILTPTSCRKRTRRLLARYVSTVEFVLNM